MVKTCLTVALGVSLLAGGLARAADLPPAPRLPAAAPETEFTGWYLRGDVGAGVNSSAPQLETIPNPVTIGATNGFLSSTAVGGFNNTTLSPSGTIGGGGGYQFNNWFRVDGTLEYRWGGALQSLYTLTDPVSPYFFGPVQYADFYRANVNSLVGLVNGYVNLPTLWDISPFVGAGLGFASNSVTGATDQGFNTSNYGSLSSGGYFANHTHTNFAWALMAGVDFTLTPNLKLEVGYRYMNLGSFSTGASSCLAGVSGAAFSNTSCFGGVSNRLQSRNSLTSNDIRIGLLWTLGEPAEPVRPLAAR